jgi:hypothetical protein
MCLLSRRTPSCGIFPYYKFYLFLFLLDLHRSNIHIQCRKILLFPPTINTCLYIDIFKYILVSRYIHIKKGISGRGEYITCSLHNLGSRKTIPLEILIHMQYCWALFIKKKKFCPGLSNEPQVTGWIQNAEVNGLQRQQIKNEQKILKKPAWNGRSLWPPKALVDQQGCEYSAKK